MRPFLDLSPGLGCRQSSLQDADAGSFAQSRERSEMGFVRLVKRLGNGQNFALYDRSYDTCNGG